MLYYFILSLKVFLFFIKKIIIEKLQNYEAFFIKIVNFAKKNIYYTKLYKNIFRKREK